MGRRVSVRFWVAFAALAAAMALLAPSFAPLSGSMDAFANDLANGTFRPFGQIGDQGKGGLSAFGTALGGFTGASPGNYLPGGSDVPNDWTMDRDGRAGVVTIDSVFTPDLGAMKRLKAFDEVLADGQTLSVVDSSLKPLQDDPSLRYDRVIVGSFPVSFHANQPVPIYSPAPIARVQSFSTDPALPGSVQFYRDGADTLYAIAHVDKVSTLNVTFVVPSDYYSLPSTSARTSDYRYSALEPRPSVSAQMQQDAKVVLARAGVQDPTDVGGTVKQLASYFRSFTEGDIPPPTEVESLYLALALGGHGCCRHRAFAFMVTAQSVGIPTRAVVNEAHAFVEVQYPNGHWHQINLGGCGSYILNNPNKYPSLFDQATDPRAEANPDEATAPPGVVTATNITDAPARIVKGQPFLVNGTVLDARGNGVPGARVDLYLNATKVTVGRLTGAGSTNSAGRFSVLAQVPADAPAQGYQLVAHGTDGRATTTRYAESWSDPSVDVFAPTQLVFATAGAAAGFPANVSGRLFDEGLAGVGNATIRWSIAGGPTSTTLTDSAGRFVVAFTPREVGTVVLAFAYDGDAHHGPVSQNVSVAVSNAALELPTTTPILLRNGVGTLSGDLVIAGGNLGGHVVSASIVGMGAAQGTSDPDGHWTIPFKVPDYQAPGIYRATYSAADLGLLQTGPVQILARATLAIGAPATISPGKPWTLAVTLAGDNGTRIPHGILQVTPDGNAGAARELLANRTGVALFDFPADALGVGTHTLSVAFLGDAAHAPVTLTQDVHVQQPFLARIPPWAYGALALLVVAAALGALALRRGSRGREWLAGVHRPERRFLSLAFPDHPPGVPPVFEPGETARVRVLVRDREGRARDAAVAVGEVRGRAAGADGALLPVPMGATARVVTLRVRALGIDRLWTRPIDITIPVASYRRAVESGFVRLRARAGLGAAATPGDVVSRLRGVPDAARAAALFEIADYSEDARVDRAFYHAFATAAIAAEEVADGV